MPGWFGVDEEENDRFGGPRPQNDNSLAAQQRRGRQMFTPPAQQRRRSFGVGGGGAAMGPQGNSWQNQDPNHPGRLINSSVNYGAVAGIGNYLQQNPGQAGGLRQQGLMPSVNGMSLDQMQPGGVFDYSGGRGGAYRGPTGMEGENTRGGIGVPGRLGRDSPGAYANPGGQGLAASFGQPGGIAAWRNGQPAQMQPQGQQGGSGGFGDPSNPTGLPLEQPLTGAIQGILDNPSGLNSRQEQQLQNRTLGGASSAYNMASQSARDDAIRRGLNPAEAEGNQSAIAARFDRAAQQQQTDYELGRAQQAQQGTLSGVNAGLGMMGQQLGNEDSIRRYLAMLQGNTPAFMSL